MRVTLSVYGRFHGFDLARELERQGALERLISSYPSRVAQRFGVPRERFVSLLPFELYGRAARRLPAALRRRLEPLAHGPFAAAAARCLPARPEVFVGWSGSSLAALAEAQRRGALTVLERGSAHIEAQCELLEGAYRAAGLRPELPPASIVARELEEYRRADLIAVPSSFVAQTFLRRGFAPERLLINPYGVDLERFRPAPELAPGLCVLFVGRASIRKGAHLLLEAFAGLEDPSARLCFVGPVERELEPWFTRFADPRVRRIGPLPQAELPPHYRAASLFCLPSYEEGMAMVLFQAAASGLPLLITPNSGGSELLAGGRAGFEVPPGDVTALRAALERARDQRLLLESMGQAARARVAQGYGWADYGRRALDGYSRALQARASAGPSQAVA
jgi:glycosyltransferase involved in cell wall biosynthesis